MYYIFRVQPVSTFHCSAQQLLLSRQRLNLNHKGEGKILRNLVMKGKLACHQTSP